MEEFKIRGDRTINSTDTNEFATGLRDETLLAEDLVEEVSLDDMIPRGVNESGLDDRPLYNESGMSDDLF